MHAPQLTEFPEYEQPRKVDERAVLPDGQQVPLDQIRHPFLAGRGHLGVLEGSPRQGYDLVGYARTPWAFVRTPVKELIAAMMGAPSTHNAENSYRVDIEDETGTLQTYSARAHSDGGDVTVFDNYPATDDFHAILRYGSDGTAPDDTHHALLAPEGGDIVNCDATWSDANLELTVSGSRLHSEAGVTAREIGAFTRFGDINNNEHVVMIDRAALDQSVDIAQDQTVTMTYAYQM